MDAQHPEDREITRKALKRALNREHDYDVEFRVLLPDGELRWLAARGVVDFDSHGRAAQLRGVWVDRSAGKTLEIEASGQRAALAHMGRVAMMSELSGSLAHELNQPLSAILNNAQAAQHYLARKNVDKAELAEILVDILGEVRRAGEVIRRMRTMLRKGTVEFEPVDINKLVQQVLSLIHSDLVARGVSVLTQLAPGLPLVRGDAVQIQQVLLNLIVNGCDAMHDVTASDRELRIETEQDSADQLRIRVADRGAGLPGEMLEKIFEPFMTTKRNGLGMGLALCRSIVTAHGGRIWASRNEGPGLSISFTLKVNSEGKM
jgi:C4-dicarboxylate-specific signal transduction histidine kinase